MFSFFHAKPDAQAQIKGYPKTPEIEGTISFYGVHGGTVVVADIRGLPEGNQFHGFHIHEGKRCTDPGGHYSKEKAQHPNHTGDMPSLLANNGIVFSAFYTNRFFPEDVVGKTVIIHEGADDFKTQPSGDSGAMIACGEIVGQI